MPGRRRGFRWVFAGSLIAIVLLGAWCFVNAAWFLVGPAQAPVKADAAFVLGGDSGGRGLMAAELHQKGLASTFVLTGASEMDGEVLPAFLYWRAAVLVRAGVPEGSIVLDTASTNSDEEAAYGLRLARARGWKRVLVVSDPPHMRRLHLLWAGAFEGSGIEVVLVASKPRWWHPERWWRDRMSAQFVVSEYIKLVYTLL